jgi:hypothetical protein
MKRIIPLLLLLTIFNHAEAFRMQSGNNVIISKPVYENLYVAGGTVTINAPIYGDLIMTGGNVTLNDTVTNDVLVAGGTVTINGYVGEDVRSAGGQISIRKGIGGELFVSGGRIETDREAFVNKGAVITGGNIIINGRIKGNTTAYGGTIAFNGTAENAVDFRGGEIEINGTVMGKSTLAAQKISIGNEASLNDDVRYWNQKGKLDFKQSLKNGNAFFDTALEMSTGQWYFLGFATIVGLLWYIGMALLMIALIQYLFSRTMQKAAEAVFIRKAKSLGYGLLFLIGVPVAIIILMITVIGIPVAFTLLFAYITIILLGTIITSVIASNWINNRYNHNWSYKKLVLAAFGMFMLLKLVSSTPFFGPLIMLVLTCTAFGAILLSINWKRSRPGTAVQRDSLEYVV